MTPDHSHPSPDYSGFSTPELNKLIHDLSVESRNRYEVQQELEKVRKAQKEKWDADLKAYLTSPRYTLDAIRNNIDTKAPRNDSEAIPDAE